MSGSDDGCVKILDVITGKCLKTLNGNLKSVRSIIKLTENKIASGADNTIKIWNIITGGCIKTFKVHSDCVNCLIKLNEYQIASCSIDKCIKICDLFNE